MKRLILLSSVMLLLGCSVVEVREEVSRQCCWVGMHQDNLTDVLGYPDELTCGILDKREMTYYNIVVPRVKRGNLRDRILVNMPRDWRFVFVKERLLAWESVGGPTIEEERELSRSEERRLKRSIRRLEREDRIRESELLQRVEDRKELLECREKLGR